MKTINLTCPSCNAEMEVNEEKLLLYCPYCGKKLQMDFPGADDVLKEKEKTKRAKERTARIKAQYEYEERNRQRENEESKKLQRKILITLVIVAVFSAIAFEMSIKFHYARGEVRTPISSTSESLKEMDCEDVELMFENEGFNNVWLVNKQDLIIGILKKEGKVESVSINGEIDFYKGKWYPSDAYVKITYHGFR